MINYMDQYRNKLTTAAQAANLVESGDWVLYPGFNGKPVAFDKALAARKEDLHGVVILNSFTIPPLPDTIMSDPSSEHFALASPHFSLVDRKLHDVNRAWYVPGTYCEVPLMVAGGYIALNVSVFQVSAMDEHGFFNFGPQNSYTMSIAQQARKLGKPVIVEVNHNMPRCLGGFDEGIHISQVDYIIEGENPDLFEVPNLPSTPEDQIIADYIINQIKDGDCIQLGIGGAPNIIGGLIANSDLKDLGVHTEMLIDSYIEMYERGCITNARKAIDRNRMAYTFAMGSKRLYEFINNNPACVSYPSTYINDPKIAAQNPNLVSINNTLTMDLFGQTTGESDGYRQISGMGGMLDFVTAAFRSEGGRSFIIMQSTYKDSLGELRSRIVPRLREGTIVTVPRGLVHWVVTEHGMTCLKGKTTWQRAEALIELAAPQFRDELVKESAAMKIWRRSNRQDA
jgi:acyl-CoA hydrolase